ncbi:MAG: hypothetical protein ACREMB_25000 [Candidatus Rokuibacteriota bacterium]
MTWWVLTCGVVLVLGLVIPALSSPPAPRATEPVRIDGEVVPGGEAKIDIMVEIGEENVGDGSDPTTILLAPVRKRLTLLIVAPGRIPRLDTQFPAAAPVTRFAAEPGDGRVFTNCLVTGFKFEGPARQRFLYSLRCEDVTT